MIIVASVWLLRALCKLPWVVLMMLQLFRGTNAVTLALGWMKIKQVACCTSKLKELLTELITNHFCCIGLGSGGSMQGSAMPIQVPHIRPGSHLKSWSTVKMQLRWEGPESLPMARIFFNDNKSHLKQKFCTKYGADRGSCVKQSLLNFRFQDAVDVFNLCWRYH